jgi:hypothetical protein
MDAPASQSSSSNVAKEVKRASRSQTGGQVRFSVSEPKPAASEKTITSGAKGKMKMPTKKTSTTPAKGSSSSTSSVRRRRGDTESEEEKRLRYAVEDGDAGKVELCLQESGISPGVELKREQATPLHLAAAKGYYSVVEVLLRMGAPVDPLDKDRVTPLYVMCVLFIDCAYHRKCFVSS